MLKTYLSKIVAILMPSKHATEKDIQIKLKYTCKGISIKEGPDRDETSLWDMRCVLAFDCCVIRLNANRLY